MNTINQINATIANAKLRNFKVQVKLRFPKSDAKAVKRLTGI